MSVVGLDVGNENCIVAVARQRGIDVVLNDESKRETPALISFSEKQRFLGTAASASLTMNPRNTVSQVKRLLGRRFRGHEVQRDIQDFPFLVSEGPDGMPLIRVFYLGEDRVFTPTQILGMILSNLKSIAEKNLQMNVTDCVIGIPVFFSDTQRRAMLDAASIAGLRPLCLMHETTSTALAYGIYQTDLPESDPINVAFVDVGHASMQVCIAAFKRGHLKLLTHVYNRSLGGRDLDDVLFRHFCASFKVEYKIDVLSSARACQRLRSACEKMKKVLSANPEALLNIECLMDEKDVRGFMKREDFETLAHPILEQVRDLCERALVDADISTDKLSALEVVGSGSRVPAILKILSNVFQKEPRRTMNASESVGRGCALRCAMLSPTFRVREFVVQEAFPFSISIRWKSTDAGGTKECSSIVFQKGISVPITKVLTFYRQGSFSFDVLYTDMRDHPPDTSQKISTYVIGPFQPKNGKAKIKVKLTLNLHGIVSLESATMVDEEEVESPTEKTINTEPKKEEGADGVGISLDAFEPEQASQLEVEPSKKNAKVKKAKNKDIQFQEFVLGGLVHSDLVIAIEKEYEMALQDRVMEETKDKKNAVESYVYAMRDKIYDTYKDYATAAELEVFAVKLQETEDWLYAEGEDETKGVYVSTLAELKKLGDPIEERFKEEEARGPYIEQLLYCINSFREAARSKDSKFDHIKVAEKEKVIIECNKAEDWLKEKKRHQEKLPKSTNPTLLSAEVKRRTETLDRFCKPIMTKPRPVPKTTSSPRQSKGAAGKGRANNGASGGETQQNEPMETEGSFQEGDWMQTD